MSYRSRRRLNRCKLRHSNRDRIVTDSKMFQQKVGLNITCMHPWSKRMLRNVGFFFYLQEEQIENELAVIFF